MKKKVIILGVIAALVIAAVVVVAIVFTVNREGVAINSWSGSGMDASNAVNDTWTVSAARVNGNSRMRVDFSAGNLAAMRVNSTSGSGRVLLKLIQGDVEVTVDISGTFNQRIDMGDFVPGLIQLRLEYENAENVNIEIKW